MTRVECFRALWFSSQPERSWFSRQYANYYCDLRKSVVLYALKRLALIFRVRVEALDGSTVLLSHLCKVGNECFLRRIMSSLFPAFRRNPMQMILDDYTDAMEALVDYGGLRNRLEEKSLVSDYVKVLAEFDAVVRQKEDLRVITFLGMIPR